MIIEELLSIFEGNEKLSSSQIQKRLNDLMAGKKLHEQIGSLKKYRSDAKGKIASSISIKFQQYTLYFLFHDEVVDMIGEAWRQSPEKDITQFRINATTKLYNKSRQIMLDLLALFETGALTSTLTLWRSMYENFVFAKYLLSVSDEESDRFNDYTVIQMKKISKEYAKTNKKKIAAILDKYGNDFLKDYGWMIECKKKSIDGIITYTKEKEFDDYYRLSSMQIHASPFSVNKSIFHDGDHGSANMLGVFREGMELPFNLAIKVMSRFAEMMIGFFLKDEMKEMLLLANNLVSNSAAMPVED